MSPYTKIDIIKDFIEYCVEYLEIDELPKIKLITDTNWPKTLHSFGMYKNNPTLLNVYVKNRNLADILRTMCHELVHHRQNELNMMYVGAGETGSNIENEANVVSGMILRKYGKKNPLIYESKLSNLLESVKSTNYQIYCDMDGVLCDFEAQFDHYYGTLPREYSQKNGPEIFKKAVDDIGVKYWAEMPWFPGGQQLWNYIGDYSPIILSSPSAFKFAQEGKLMWIKKYLNPQPKDIIFKQTGQKESAIADMNARRCILIDDYYKNIAPWKELGGIGITHKDTTKTISILQKFGL